MNGHSDILEEYLYEDLASSQVIMSSHDLVDSVCVSLVVSLLILLYKGHNSYFCLAKQVFTLKVLFTRLLKVRKGLPILRYNNIRSPPNSFGQAPPQGLKEMEYIILST